MSTDANPDNCAVCEQMTTDPNGAMEKLGGGAYNPTPVPVPTSGNAAAKHDPKPFNISQKK